MAPENSLPHSQQPATCPYPEHPFDNSSLLQVPLVLPLKSPAFRPQSVPIFWTWLSEYKKSYYFPQHQPTALKTNKCTW